MSSGQRSRIECFWLEPTELASSELRRYEKISYSPMPPDSCPQNRMRHHDTTVYVGEVSYPFQPEGINGYGCDDVPHDDLNWPKTCHTCGFSFREEDHWQHNVNRLFKGAPDGKFYTLRNAPPGAMYDASWFGAKGSDGIALAVVLPPNGGDDVWMPDHSSKQGNPWTRTGTIPKVTCTPSILTSNYHGYLRAGWLEEC
jgi:hypothetical protein